MNAVERTVGTWLHRLILRHPAAHAELLNQYRASEDFARRFPRTVCTELLPEGPLRVKYAKHQADEERHEELYAERIGALGGKPRAVGPARDYMLAMWRGAMSVNEGIAYARFGQKQPFGPVERVRMFALQVAVEERGLEEMALHRAVCEAAGDAATAELLARIEPDERHHAAYSWEAVKDAADACMALGGSGGCPYGLAGEEAVIAGAAFAKAMVSAMKSIERAAYRAVSAAFMRELLAGPLAGASRFERTMLGAIVWVTDPGAPVPEAGGAW
jgi:hypothetical protein